MLTEKHVQFANNNILPLGYKPEDYYGVASEEQIKKIAFLIFKEANHLALMEKMIRDYYMKTGNNLATSLLYFTNKLGTKRLYGDLIKELS